MRGDDRPDGSDAQYEVEADVWASDGSRQVNLKLGRSDGRTIELAVSAEGAVALGSDLIEAAEVANDD